jgi:hypothetical protein
VSLELLLKLYFFPAIVVPTLAFVCVRSVGWRVLAIATALGLIGALFVLVLRVGVGLLRTGLRGRLKVGVSFLVWILILSILRRIRACLLAVFHFADYNNYS